MHVLDLEVLGMYINLRYTPVTAGRFFCPQIDESTDVAGLAVLLAFVRYVYNTDVRQGLLLCKTLTSLITKELFKI